MKVSSVLFLLGATACGAGIAQPPEEALALPSDTLEAKWAELPRAAPAGSGRWAVVSPEWNEAVIAEFGANALAPLGGPKQQAYANPFMLFTMGDTVYLADWGKRRTTVWTADGQLLDSIPVADALRGGFPRARDAAGQLYFQVDPPPQRDGSGNQDSIAIVRAPGALTRFDTVARLAPRELVEVQRENSTRFEQQIFSGNDLWGVWPDGTVWIARRHRNQLITIDSRGTLTKGPELPDPVYEVTQADRDRHLQAYPVDVRPKEIDLAWALLFPPFDAAFTAPDGTVWLEKTKPVLDSLRRIQVLDRLGNLKRVLVLRGQARLLAVGSEKLLLAEQFERGVRLLEVRIPAAPSAEQREQ
ncbi:MAG TPA: hypothetical protein VGQ69_15195 [Gemmatimonadales bacterium]|jgi:hypothetical protein|nr:hypothetical protein [Gemmatimonadales bacterium]